MSSSIVTVFTLKSTPFVDKAVMLALTNQRPVSPIIDQREVSIDKPESEVPSPKPEVLSLSPKYGSKVPNPIFRTEAVTWAITFNHEGVL